MLMQEDPLSLQEYINNWTEIATAFINECNAYAQPFIAEDSAHFPHNVRFVSTELLNNCHQTSESVLYLIAHGKEWDADLLARSIMEGSIKYIYMLLGTTEEMEEKVYEYWITLRFISSIKISEKAKRFLEAMPNPQSYKWQGIRSVVLSDEDAAVIRNNYSRAERQAIEERWSFTGIIKHFLASEDNALRYFSMSVHHYGLASHLVHKDSNALIIQRDRNQRSLERVISARTSHAARVITDICNFWELRLIYLVKVHKLDSDFFIELRNKYKTLFEETEKAHTIFHSIEYGTKANEI